MFPSSYACAREILWCNCNFMQRPMPRRIAPVEQDDATDEGQRQRKEAAASLRAQRHREIERAILASPEGREWLWQILADCHTFEERLPVTAAAYEQGVFSGQRGVGLDLMRSLARSSPQHFALLFTENDT
jgi:hypothetical protein